MPKLFIIGNGFDLAHVEISDFCIVGANSVLNKSVKEENIVVGGIPAKKISNNGMKNRIDV